MIPAPTATAAPHKVITVKAPIDRRAMLRAGDPVTCHLPETPTAKFSSDTYAYRWSTSVCTITLLLATGVTRARLRSEGSASQ